MMKSNLKRLLFDRDLKPYHLAKATGIDPHTIAMLMRAEVKYLNVKHLEKLCKYFGVPIQEIIFFANE